MAKKFKLPDNLSGQQVGILVIGGILVFMSLIQALTSSTRRPGGEQQTVVEHQAGEPRYQNPKMTWFEKYFCRGYQRSGRCNFRLLHPFRDVFEEMGVEVEEGPAPQTAVIDYSGPLPHKRFGGRADVSKIAEEEEYYNVEERMAAQ